MPQLRLAAWKSVWYDWIVDSDTGVATRVRLQAPRQPTSPILGFADTEHSLDGHQHTFAIYFERDSLYFSVGSRRWLLSETDIRFSHRARPFVSTFQVHEGHSIAFAITYAHLRRTELAVIDPTYDGIDFDHDYFLGFIAGYAASHEWQANVRKLWL